jgi:CHAD domain-containing protein
MLVCCSWVEGAGWRRALTEAQRGPLDSPIRRFADKTLVRDQERLLKRGNRLRGADPATRHRVRIAAKKTRYATEFFQTLYPARRVGPYVKALSQLQDELGSLNDAAVATTLLQGLETARPDIASNASFVRGYLTRRTNSDDIALESLWKKFRPLALPCQRRLR